jgi:hypothetical protein
MIATNMLQPLMLSKNILYKTINHGFTVSQHKMIYWLTDQIKLRQKIEAD